MDTRPVASAVTASEIGRREVLLAEAGAALALATLSESVEAAAVAKSGWRFCPDCRGLFAGKGTRSVGACPDGGTHTPATAYSYVLLADLSVTNPSLFKNWFQCKKCRGLFFDDLGETGVCPKGGAHVGTGPAYALWKGTALPFMETGWDECGKCHGLFWHVNSNGVCPAGGEHLPRVHDAEDYKLIILL
jgi:hypothetical protein